MSRIAFLAAVLAASLAGCSWSENIEKRVAPDTVSLADRCGAIMQAAMPYAQLELGDRTSRSPDVATIIAQVAATRTDLPKGAASGSDLMAECTFVNNVMTAFRWTKGGPPPPPSAANPPPGTDTTSPGLGPGSVPPASGAAKPFH